jgi:ubiquitin-like domain-containing CTD phosphatase 1
MPIKNSRVKNNAISETFAQFYPAFYSGNRHFLGIILAFGIFLDMLYEHTNVLPKRQKLIGLTTQSKVKVTDQILLSALKSKSKLKPSTSVCNDTDISKPVVKHNFILMGTAEQDIFIDPSDVAANDLPAVVNDFDFDFTAGSQEWLAHVATGMNLKRFTESTEINIIAEPRPGKPLMVLDLDHTLVRI